ncbi:MAG: hypothetical protein JKY55_16075 [Aliivibrio sp.]|uniref:hypothetical protein n=1 Tax=Aliivibrio sp. TaxID=1872443 RepID=UPI001A4BF7D3|nr:hypothetical protein [Aliivibrio sp.]
MNTKYSARQNGQIIEIEFPDTDGHFDAWLYINAEPEDKRIHFQGNLEFELNKLAKINVTDLTGKDDDTDLSNQGHGPTLVKSTLAFFQHHFSQQSLINTIVDVKGELSDIGDNSSSSHGRRVTFWRKMGLVVQNPSDHYSSIDGVLGQSGCGTSSEVDPQSFLDGNDVRSMSHLQDSDVTASINLYERSLKDGCKQLLNLNKFLKKAQRKQMSKQTYYHLGWTVGMSSSVIFVSYLLGAVNFYTAGGLIAAYFLSKFMHNRFSPTIVLPKERDELFELNNKLRIEIAEVEEQSRGNLCRLLEATGLEEHAESNGFQLGKSQITMTELDGNGLYQYLDAMNLLNDNRKQVEALITE